MPRHEPARTFFVIANVQLALRHPSNPGRSAPIAMAIAPKLERILAPDPESSLAAICDAGGTPLIMLWNHHTTHLYEDGKRCLCGARAVQLQMSLINNGTPSCRRCRAVLVARKRPSRARLRYRRFLLVRDVFRGLSFREFLTDPRFKFARENGGEG